MKLNMPVFLAYCRSEFLFDHKEGQGYFTPATVFAVSILPNEPMKLQILADDSVMFSNIPVSALSNSKTAPKLNEEDVVYAVCPDDNATIIQYSYLSTVEDCGVWNKDNTFWQRGIYLFTIEWEIENQQMHFVELEDGNYCLWDNKHITWSAQIPETLPKYGAE